MVAPHATSGHRSGDFSMPIFFFFFFSSRRRHTRSDRDWSSDVCSSDLATLLLTGAVMAGITLVAIRGLDLGKWLHNIGSIGIMTAYGILLLLPIWALLRDRKSVV